MHGLLYTSEAEPLRAFLRDKLGLPATDVGDGWLLFGLPEGELGCHPLDHPQGPPSGTHELSFTCDDVAATVAELAARGVEGIAPIEDHGYGLVTRIPVPGGFTLQLYQPRYPLPVAGASGATELLRHTLATLAYRGAKVLRGAAEGFATFTVGPTTRTPLAILAHVGDLLDWALTIADGEVAWKPVDPASWQQQVDRFFAGLRRLDERLAGAPLCCPPGSLFQGPIADALSHFGQLAMLRRLAGAPVRGESYYRAEIVVGRVGAEQAPPRRELD